MSIDPQPWQDTCVSINDGSPDRLRLNPDEPVRPSLLAWQEELNASGGFRAIALMSYVRRIGYLLQGERGAVQHAC
jgi:hypothetical protein